MGLGLGPSGVLGEPGDWTPGCPALSPCFLVCEVRIVLPSLRVLVSGKWSAASTRHGARRTASPRRRWLFPSFEIRRRPPSRLEEAAVVRRMGTPRIPEPGHDH